MTVNGNLDVGNSVSGAYAAVTNGLVLNGTLLVGNPTNNYYGGVSFAGTQTLSGSGTVVFGDNSSYNALLLANDGTTLTIGLGITIRGQNGTIGGYNRCVRRFAERERGQSGNHFLRRERGHDHHQPADFHQHRQI